jgi:hypothetical protein
MAILESFITTLLLPNLLTRSIPSVNASYKYMVKTLRRFISHARKTLINKLFRKEGNLIYLIFRLSPSAVISSYLWHLICVLELQFRISD